MVCVLIVDDEEYTRELLGILYRSLGCDIISCSTQAEAERHLAEGKFFDIVHLDDNLTKASSGRLPHEGSRILLPIALQHGCKVIGCSTELRDEKGNPLWPDGITVIRKPFSPNEFKNTVGQVIISLGS